MSHLSLRWRRADGGCVTSFANSLSAPLTFRKSRGRLFVLSPSCLDRSCSKRPVWSLARPLHSRRRSLRKSDRSPGMSCPGLTAQPPFGKASLDRNRVPSQGSALESSKSFADPFLTIANMLGARNPASAAIVIWVFIGLRSEILLSRYLTIRVFA